MNIEAIESLYFAYAEGELTEAERADVETRLQNDAAFREVFEEMQALEEQMEADPVMLPGAAVRDTFLQQLEAEKAQTTAPATGPKRVSLPQWMVAASVSLLVGLAVGWLLHGQAGAGQQNQVAQLEAQLNTLQQVVLLSQMQQKSASQRLATVQASHTLPANSEVVSALVSTLRTDPSDNVRLAAVEALQHFGQQTNVGPALASALKDQTDPMLQIVLIDLLVEMDEKGAVNELLRLTQNEEATEQVRNHAQKGLGALL